MPPLQAAPDSTRPTFKTSKRSACDRCRWQKLRCPPKEKGQQSCDRCARLGSECVTSYLTLSTKSSTQATRTQNQEMSTSNRSTAANLNSNQSMAPNLDSRSKHKEVNLVLQSPRGVVSAAKSPLGSLPVSSSFSSSINAATNDLVDWSWFSQAGIDENELLYDGTSDMLPVPFPEGNTDLMSGALSFLDNANLNDGGESASCSIEDIVGQFAFPEMGDTTHTCYTSESAQSQSSLNTPNKNVSASFQTDRRLSILGLDLSKRLEQCVVARRQSWNFQVGDNSSSSSLWRGATALAEETDPMDRDQSQDRSVQNSPFANVLNYASEFIAIIQSYGATQRLSRSQNSQPPPGILVTLNVLSVYLQIIAIYDHLFWWLYDQLSSATAQASLNISAVLELQSLPRIQLAGFSVDQEYLETKILIQMILHQLEVIEKILGLPTEFRVSDREDVHVEGLLGDERARALMKSAMAEGRKCAQVTIDGLQEASGIRVLGSLKDKIKKIREFLEIGSAFWCN